MGSREFNGISSLECCEMWVKMSALWAYLNSHETRPTVCILGYAARARRLKPRQGSIHAIVGHNQK